MKQSTLKIILELLSVFYLFGMMVFIWQIDLSIGILTRGTGMMTNGWQTFDPMQIYHISLFSLIGITLIYICIMIYLFIKKTAIVEKQHLNDRGAMYRWHEFCT